MHDRPAQFIENHDGDTVTMLLDQDFYDRKQINIRLANVWAPESYEYGGADVQQFVDSWFEERVKRGGKWPFIVYTDVTKKGTQVKSFDRYVGTVMTADLKESLNSDIMRYIVEKGYGGGIGST